MSRDAGAIEREIEETRAELARTVDLIAERLSPRRAAGRGATKVREGIEGVFHRANGNGQVHDTDGDGTPFEPREPSTIHAVPVSYRGTTTRTLRKDRVAIAVGAVAAVVGLVVILKRRRG
jgi:hypothetical protein